MTLPDSSLFAAAIADRRFLAALAVAALSGVVRGFSGFGSALIYMPLVAAVYDPRVAAVTLLLIDTVGAAPFAVRANLLVYFLLLDAMLCVVYYWQGLLSADLLALSALLAIPFFVATAVGAYFFAGTSDLIYRRIAYVIIAAAALVSLPLLDSWLR